MKVCDAADWFRPDFVSIIANELHEMPRFHRKQWEFAAKFNLPRTCGVLREDAHGISFGTGQRVDTAVVGAMSLFDFRAMDRYHQVLNHRNRNRSTTSANQFACSLR